MCTYTAIVRTYPENEYVRRHEFTTGSNMRWVIGRTSASGSNEHTYDGFLRMVGAEAADGNRVELSTQLCDVVRDRVHFQPQPCSPYPAKVESE